MRTKTKFGVSHVLGVWGAALIAVVLLEADATLTYQVAATWTSIVVIAHLVCYEASSIVAKLRGLEKAKK